LHFDLQDLVAQHRLDINEVLHVGAHLGQEADLYQSLGATQVTWVEGNPAVVPLLLLHVEPLGHRVLTALVSNRSGDVVDFHITNNEQSSSFLKLGTHKYEHPDIVVTESVPLRTTTLDDLCESEGVASPNLLVLDVQGAELLVLQGAERVIAGTDCICTEVNERPLYAGAVLLPELDSFLDSHGFDRVATTLTIHGYGDALYIRRESDMSPPSPELRTARRTGHELVRALRRRIGLRVREIVAGATNPRFDSVDAQVAQLSHRLGIIEQMLVRNELEIAAMREQLDAFLNVTRTQTR